MKQDTTLIADIILGYIENNLIERKKQNPDQDEFWLIPGHIGIKLGLSTNVVRDVFEKLVREKKLMRVYAHTCTKYYIPLKETKKPIDKAYCYYCNKKHSKDRETMWEEVRYYKLSSVVFN